MRNWLESKSVRNIQVFLNFANFYQQFIQSFNSIAGLFTFIFRISPNQSAEPSSLSTDVFDNVEVGISDGSNKRVKKLLFYIKLTNGVISHSTLNAKATFT